MPGPYSKPKGVRIEGGGKGGWEPKQTYEKNLSYL